MKNFDNYPVLSEKDLNDALGFCVQQILTVLPEFTDKFQKAYSENNFYEPVDNTDWTNGFWTGEIWLAYEYATENPDEVAKLRVGTPAEAVMALRTAGEVQIASFLDRIVNKISVDHHDMGFLYSPSCVAGYKLVGSEDGKKAAILAAGGKSDKAVTAMLDVEALKASKNRDADIKTALEACQKDHAYLFGSDEPINNPVGTTGGGTGAANPLAAVRAAMGLPETK